MWEMQNSPLGSAGRERRRFHQKLPIPNEALLEIRAHAININAIFFASEASSDYTSNFQLRPFFV